MRERGRELLHADNCAHCLYLYISPREVSSSCVQCNLAIGKSARWVKRVGLVVCAVGTCCNLSPWKVTVSFRYSVDYKRLCYLSLCWAHTHTHTIYWYLHVMAIKRPSTHTHKSGGKVSRRGTVPDQAQVANWFYCRRMTLSSWVCVWFGTFSYLLYRSIIPLSLSQ